MHRPPPPAGVGLGPGAGPSSYAPPARPIIIEPSRTPSPELNPESGADEYTYTAGPLMWRDWEGSGRTVGRGAEGVQAVEILSESTQAGQAFVLYCGGEDSSVVEEDEPPRRFEPTLFPGSPSSPSKSAPARTHGKAVRRSNGCGALVHVRAYPQRPRGVWMAKEDAAETVVGLDPAYCDHPSMDKMLKSACGCIREGIGCSVWYVSFCAWSASRPHFRHAVGTHSAPATCPARRRLKASSRLPRRILPLSPYRDPSVHPDRATGTLAPHPHIAARRLQ